MQLGFLSLLQFFLDPLQYFSFTRIGIIPGIYLGRILSLLLIITLLVSPRHQHRFFIIKSFRIALFSLPYAPFIWITIIAAIPALLTSDSVYLLIRFAIIEPFTNIAYIAIFTILPSLASSQFQRLKASQYILPFINLFLSIGYLDFFASCIGINLLGRSIFDRVEVGARFHSLSHEPRDYVVTSVYLLAFLAVANISSLSSLTLPAFGLNYKSFTLSLLIFSVFLAKSSTFFAGLAYFLMLCAIYILVMALKKFTAFPRLLARYATYAILAIPFVYLFSSFIFDIRISTYLETFSSIFTFSTDHFIDSLLVTPLLKPQASTFLPMLKFFEDFSFGNILNILFGYGHGFISNYLSSQLFFDSTDIYNSYSGLPRLLCETGIIGLASFSYMYFSIILVNKHSHRHSLALTASGPITLYYLCSIALFCMYLAHRRQEIFLFMGIVNCYLKPSAAGDSLVSPRTPSA